MKAFEVVGDLSLELISDTKLNMSLALSYNAGELFQGVFSKILRENDGTNSCRLTDEEIAHILQVNSKTVGVIMPALAKEIFDASFVYNNKTSDGFESISLNVTSFCQYKSGEGLLIYLNPFFCEYFVWDEGNYFRKPIKGLPKNKKNRASDLLEYILTYTREEIPEKGVIVDVPIIDLVCHLRCENYLSNVNSLKSRVLIPSVNMINNYTQYQIGFERLKLNSGKYDTIRFYININSHPEEFLSYKQE